MLSARMLDTVPLPDATNPTWIVPTLVSLSDRDPDIFLLALALAPSSAGHDRALSGDAAIAHVTTPDGTGAMLVDAIGEDGGEAIRDAVIAWLRRSPDEPLQGESGSIVVERAARHDGQAEVPAGATDAANAGFRSDRLAIRFLRRVNEGINPEWEIGEVLTRQGFRHIASTIGALHYRRPNSPQLTIAVLQEHVPDTGTGRDAAMASLDELIQRGRAEGIVVPRPASRTTIELLRSLDEPPTPPLASHLNAWLHFAGLLGARTADLHHALGSVTDRPAFAPEPYAAFGLRSLYQSLRSYVARTQRSLRRAAPGLEGETARLAHDLLEREDDLFRLLRAILDARSAGYRIRNHGDLHLGQVLRTDDDIVFVDVEGQPDRFPDERRLKTSPLRDVAGMLHSFGTVAREALAAHAGEDGRPAEHTEATDALVASWRHDGSIAFLRAYLRGARDDGFLPPDDADRAILLDAWLLERAVFDLQQALLHDPAGLDTALRHLAALLDQHTAA